MSINQPSRNERENAPRGTKAGEGRPTGAERRRDVRFPADGKVRLRNFGALANSFSGHLLDLAARGFRARHNCLNLTPGQLVAFEVPDRSGMAQVVWTRIVDGEAESGFRIIAI